MTSELLQSFKKLTERLELRLVKMSDSAALQKLMTPAISRWVAVWPYALTQEVAEKTIDKALIGHSEQRTLPLVIVSRTDNRVIGWIKVDFEELRIQTIRAGAQTENTVSHNLLMKLGMHRTGEQLVFAPARGREELCTYFELERSET